MLGISGCDNPWGNTQIPEPVEERFVKMHPTAERVAWQLQNGNYLVDFEISTRERSAMFSADGSLLAYSEEIDEQYLPGASLDYLQHNFGDESIDEVHRVQQDQQTYYKVQINKDEAEALLLFDEKGSLLEEQNAVQTALISSPPNAANHTATALPKPEARWELPSDLREVSGIALLERDVIACVQDEDGIIFLYDLNKQTITRRVKFAEGGDYEGIALVNNTAYVLRSDGAIYEVSPLRDGEPKAILHESVLSKTHDAEGLGYDKANNRLLIAPKGYDESLGDYHGIYAFSLADKKMQKEPVIKVSVTQEKLLSAGKKQKNKYNVLQPSSLDFNGATGELYLMDSKNHLLLTINMQGEVQKLIHLDEEQLRQPEGFSFSDTGELYISSEGSKKEPGVILKFSKGLN
ncbi:SdiA-regulated domain-containing protein [Cesiribacter sp. SM1]|uniref:SdiA-regulated domain-containing protein n=1 Tax=Cesiribacter sp. SM1 TaxID=2861196 RepID=UPI001CD709A0|nr:SdiA-regulated domain-containing protein [Cesiribacter sp. SM1]